MVLINIFVYDKYRFDRSHSPIVLIMFTVFVLPNKTNLNFKVRNIIIIETSSWRFNIIIYNMFVVDRKKFILVAHDWGALVAWEFVS